MLFIIVHPVSRYHAQHIVGPQYIFVKLMNLLNECTNQKI